MKKLMETIDLMTSDDYKKRFLAEYWQTRIRQEKLRNFCDKIEAAELMTGYKKAIPCPAHDCPLELLREQQSLMDELCKLYQIRAIIEGVDLDMPIESNDSVFE